MEEMERKRLVIDDMQYQRGKIYDSKGETPRSEYHPSPHKKAPPLPYNRRTEGDQQPSITIEPEAKREHVPLLNEDSRLKSFQREREPRSDGSKKRRDRSKKKNSKDTRKGNQAREGLPTVDKVSKNSISGYSSMKSSELNTSGINRRTRQMMEKELMKKFNV